VPLAHDQFDNGARVAALGVGASLPAARLNDARLARTLAAMLAAPGLDGRTRAVAARFAPAPGMDAMCAALDAFADTRQRRDALS
jgi:rhamnosyltransferase subunit B